MRALQLLLLMLVMPVVCHAETIACTTINTAPYVITAPGSYCLSHALANTPSSNTSPVIKINGAVGVTLDCNHHRINGPAVVTPATAESRVDIGLYLNSAGRVTVRNCHFANLGMGIYVDRDSTDLLRSRDIVLEDNTVEGAAYGLLLTADGTNIVRRNVIANSALLGLQAIAGTGQTFVTGNVVSRVGDTTTIAGTGAYFKALSGWEIIEDNTFSEVVGPPGTGSSAVYLGPSPGVGLMFKHNRVLAPANAAEKGAVDWAIDNTSFNTCEDNLQVGYGTASPPSCPAPSNEQL